MNCKYCGTELLGNSSFCIKCGKNNNYEDTNKEESKKNKGLFGTFSNLFGKWKNQSLDDNSVSDSIEIMPSSDIVQKMDEGFPEELKDNNEIKDNSSQHVDLSEEVVNDILYRIECLSDDLKQIFEEMHDDFEEISGLSHNKPMSNIINATVRCFNREAHSLAILRIQQWHDSPESLSQTMDNFQAGEHAIGVAWKCDNKLRDSFTSFWLSNPLEQEIIVEFQINSFNNDDFKELNEIYFTAHQKIKALKKKYIDLLNDYSKDNSLYCNIIPVVEAFIEPLNLFFMKYKEKLQQLVVAIEQTNSNREEKRPQKDEMNKSYKGREEKMYDNKQDASDDLFTTKVIGQTDIKYNICTFGAKFHIGFGAQVTIEINGNSYTCKTHNSAKGRIDAMKKLYNENGIAIGDTLNAHYSAEKNIITLEKCVS